MAISMSNGLKASLINTSLSAALSGTTITLFSGPVPADANEPINQSLNKALATFNLDGLLQYEVSGTNLRNRPELWNSEAKASGTATFFRIYKPNTSLSYDDVNYEVEPNSFYSTLNSIRIQGTVGFFGSDININPEITQGKYYTIEYFAIGFM